MPVPNFDDPAAEKIFNRFQEMKSNATKLIKGGYKGSPKKFIKKLGYENRLDEVLMYKVLLELESEGIASPLQEKGKRNYSYETVYGPHRSESQMRKYLSFLLHKII